MMGLTPIGARLNETGAEFSVWAPHANRVEVLLPEATELKKEARGYFKGQVAGIKAGQNYKLRLDGKEDLPDPASRFQPEGVHGPSQVIDFNFAWTDQSWKGIPLEELVIYELHTGTFTAEGSFAAIKDHLGRLKKLGVTAIEIMPVGQFPGKRNWGYDGVNIFAPQNSYGPKNSPQELQSLVNECHKQGLAVILDVVYNHLGPEGNHLSKWGPYFQDKYKTPWGDALNFDGPGSDEVRNYFLQNVRQWIEDYHFDGLRLDAIHAIMDTSAKPFLAEVSELVHSLAKKHRRAIWVIGESDGNDPRVLQATEMGGLGMDAQWSDDLHHCLHSFLTQEKEGYYADYGAPGHLAEVFSKGTCYTGQYSEFRQRRHGQPYARGDRKRLVVCAQNHDQIGNRAQGERLSLLLDESKMIAAAAWTFLFGGLPLIFMGEEMGEENPFAYFVDHGDPALLKAVQEGRKKEFSSFTWQGEIPDPAAEKTFHNSRPDWQKLETAKGKLFFDTYKRLIEISKDLRRKKVWEHENLQVELQNEQKLLSVTVPGHFYLAASLCTEPLEITFSENLPLVYALHGENLEGAKITLRPYSVAVFYE